MPECCGACSFYCEDVGRGIVVSSCSLHDVILDDKINYCDFFHQRDFFIFI